MYIGLISIATCIGCLFFLYQESYIIISLPFKQTISAQTIKNSTNTHLQNVSLWFFTHNKYKKETTEIVFSDDSAQNIKLLLNNWFLVLEQEGIINQQINLQLVAQGKSKDLFISLSQSPFNRESSSYQKLMIMESMLKTIRENQPGISSVWLLVQYQPLIDDHLNFEIGWPIEGFL